jgi:outer membrane protein OmpA-like peptidoglycan-associated protein
MKKCLAGPVVIPALIAILTIPIIANAQATGDVRRRTISITYLKDRVKVQFAGTTLRPNAQGEANVERLRKRNSTDIEISIKNLIPAFNYGADYNTYVLWAITPAGQFDNLGEFRLSNGSARLRTSTSYQDFAMIVTAEPHYLVRLPSRMVVLENLAPTSTKVQLQVTEISFAGDSGRFYRDTTVPSVVERDYNKIPMELLQARRAVQIARLADSETYDPDDYRAATRALDQAEDAFRRGLDVHEIGRLARESISVAVRARDVAEDRATAAERRAEIARRDAEVQRATETATDLGAQLSNVEARLKASELARTNAEDHLARVMRDSADARAENRNLRAQNDRLEDDVTRLTKELADARAQIAGLQNQFSSTAQKLTEVSSRAESMERAERERREAEARRRDFSDLQSALSRIVLVKPSGSGFVAILPDNFFVSNQTALALRIKDKMDALAQALAAHSGAVFTIEGHCDSRRDADQFAFGRAQAVADYVAAFGVSHSNFRIESRGSSVPVTSSKSAGGRASNRRVELVFPGPE